LFRGITDIRLRGIVDGPAVQDRYHKPELRRKHHTTGLPLQQIPPRWRKPKPEKPAIFRWRVQHVGLSMA